MQDQFRVAGRVVHVAVFRSQLRDELASSVDASVGRDPCLRVEAERLAGLRGLRGGIEWRMPERRRPFPPCSRVAAAAGRKEVRHCRDASAIGRPGAEMRHPANSAHRDAARR